MDSEQQSLDRRTYMKIAGAAGVVGTVGLAGCLEGNGENGDEENGGAENGDEENGGAENGDDESGANQIVAGTAPGFAPFEMVEDGELVGFDIDLLEAVIDETEYELSGWEQLEFASLIPALDNGNIDVIAAAMTINEERQEQIAFSEPYYSANQSVLVASGGDFQPESLEDLADRTVGAQSGTTGEQVVRDDVIDAGIIPEGNYTSFDNYVLAVEDLERGVIDAVVIDEPVAQTFQSSRDVEVAFIYETGEQYGFGVRQDAEDLQSALSEGITAVEESGEYEEITSTWFDQ
ncbi:basic amino acid ABC transporter substrate-binding protein [Natronoarchaeum sp. GCM10025703]|uniref:basic amino acid ABC transporter substrate-binding protein n=1 Tax=unclassified Natronoarchaeum TaxID=2620183 RepID=UPI00360C5994